jgi:NADH-quinone oxidoreductase subunit E
MLSDELRAEITALMDRYEEPRSALMPAFWLAQKAQGHLAEDAIEDIAHIIGVDPGYASGVASFYTLYHLEPVGRYVLQVCKTLSCRMAGAEDILEHLRQRLQIDVGGTTDDGKFSLMTAECLASCGTGPVMMVNHYMHENVTVERVDEILDGLPD